MLSRLFYVCFATGVASLADARGYTLAHLRYCRPYADAAGWQTPTADNLLHA